MAKWHMSLCLAYRRYREGTWFSSRKPTTPISHSASALCSCSLALRDRRWGPVVQSPLPLPQCGRGGNRHTPTVENRSIPGSSPGARTNSSRGTAKGATGSVKPLSRSRGGFDSHPRHHYRDVGESGSPPALGAGITTTPGSHSALALCFRSSRCSIADGAPWFKSSHPDHLEGVAQQAELRVANAEMPDHPRPPSPRPPKLMRTSTWLLTKG